MEKIKEVQICFENCEFITLKPSMFKYLLVYGIKTNKKINCYQYENGEIQETRSCEYFSIEINKEGLKQICWDCYLRERLKGNDITIITIRYTDNCEEDIYVDWSEKDEWTNEYQKNTYLDDGSIKVVVSKEVVSNDK